VKVGRRERTSQSMRGIGATTLSENGEGKTSPGGVHHEEMQWVSRV